MERSNKSIAVDGRKAPVYSYQKSEPGVWTVGRFRNDGSWEQESRWSTQEEAAEHAHALNDVKKPSAEA